jgi:hypothetical protein
MPPGQIMSTVDENFIQFIVLDDILCNWPQIRSELKIDPETGLATNAIVVKLNYRSMPPVNVKITAIEPTVIRDVYEEVDAVDLCQTLMVVARVRHPQQPGAFLVEKIYSVSALEKMYIMEREEEEEDEMSTESDYESDD